MREREKKNKRNELFENVDRLSEATRDESESSDESIRGVNFNDTKNQRMNKFDKGFDESFEDFLLLVQMYVT